MIPEPNESNRERVEELIKHPCNHPVWTKCAVCPFNNNNAPCLRDKILRKAKRYLSALDKAKENKEK
jgi:hypothetical protein